MFTCRFQDTDSKLVIKYLYSASIFSKPFANLKFYVGFSWVCLAMVSNGFECLFLQRTRGVAEGADGGTGPGQGRGGRHLAKEHRAQRWQRRAQNANSSPQARLTKSIIFDTQFKRGTLNNALICIAFIRGVHWVILSSPPHCEYLNWDIKRVGITLKTYAKKCPWRNISLHALHVTSLLYRIDG